MNDVLEELFEAVEEEINQGVSLVISSMAIPSGGVTAQQIEGELALRREAGELPSIETENVEQILAQQWAEEGIDLDGQASSTLERGRGVSQWAVEETVGHSLIQQMAGVERRAKLAQHYLSGGQGGGATAAGTEVGERRGATSFPVASATRRQSVATVETARTVDRAIERDARRYDGGFLLG